MCKAAQKSGCWSCSGLPKPKISVSVAFRPRLALTSFGLTVQQPDETWGGHWSLSGFEQSGVNAKTSLQIRGPANFFGLIQSALCCCTCFPKGACPGLLPTHWGKNYFLHYNSRFEMNVAVILNRLSLHLVKSLVQPDLSALRLSNWKELKCRESDLKKKMQLGNLTLLQGWSFKKWFAVWVSFALGAWGWTH